MNEPLSIKIFFAKGSASGLRTAEIVEQLEAALEEFRSIEEVLAVEA